MTGTGSIAIRVRRGSIPSMKLRESSSRITTRMRFVICSARKFFRVSMSEVQRWMMSPVLLCMCQAYGRRSRCEKSRSRMVFTRVSAARVLLTS